MLFQVSVKLLWEKTNK